MMQRMTTSNEEEWAQRVAEWRASGVPQRHFVAGRGFSASALGYWARRLERERAGATGQPRLARVLRSGPPGETGVSGAGVTIVSVSRDFDRATLRAVLEALGR